MFERFTERARQVVVLSQEAARSFKHNYIGTEHVLLGLLREEEGIAARVLGTLGVTDEDASAEVVRIAGRGEEVTYGQIPFTPRAKKLFELSLREALALGHNYIGTEHILLGLARDDEGVASRILADRDVNAEKVRNEVVYFLTNSRRATAPAPVELADLTKPGDLMQSALSRIAEWARNMDAPYEVHMAALEATDAIGAWTEARRKMS